MLESKPDAAMPLSYAVKHVFRSWKLFLALLIGITLASTFFAGIDIKASATAREALYQDLDRVNVDMTIQLGSLNSTQVADARELIATTSGVLKAEILGQVSGQLKINGSLMTYEYARIVGMENTSSVYDGWLNRPSTMGANETYIWENSEVAGKVNIGDSCQVVFTIYPANQTEPISATWDFLVKGFAQLDAKAYSIVSSYSYSPIYADYRDFVGGDIFLVDWEATMLALSEAFRAFNPQSELTSASLLVHVNRDALITPWDMETSVKNIRGLQYQIQNKLSTHGISAPVSNNLETALVYFTLKSMSIRMAFTFVSLPIFFMAWYMGTTVSDVSLNLRRREIGLLLTKGFSRGQVQRMLLTETLFLGILGGALGVFFGFLLIPLFTELSLEMLFNPQLISPYTLITTMAFGAIMALLSTYSSAKRASQLPTIDALREYLNVEAVKPYRKRGPWIAFLLGTYKIVVYVLGINVTTLVIRLTFSGANFFLVLLAIPVLFIDLILSYIGPLLFFWGTCKILIQGSLKFQELTTRVAKSLGDLGALATKNVRRNPARSAATAFLIALIISYSVQVTGQLASEHDFNVRDTRLSVGADISVYVTYPEEAQNVYSAILANVSNSVENATIEYFLDASSSSGYRTTVKVIQPQSWLKAAYCESDWFSGNSAETAIASFLENKNTIVLERSLASSLNLGVGDLIALSFGGAYKSLLIVGFFGPESGQQSTFLASSSSYYWSLVSEELYNDLNSTVSAYSARILMKLKTGVNGTSVAESIRNLSLNVSGVASFAEQWEEKQSDVLTVGILDAQRLGILFAVLAASVGTALVSFVSMKERSREATIMSVRGLSYKQLVAMFLTENLALITFAAVLGVSVGFIVIYGNISASNSVQTALIQRRIVFPLDATVTLVSCIALIFVSTILPILVMSRRYVTKLERMVRLR